MNEILKVELRLNNKNTAPYGALLILSLFLPQQTIQKSKYTVNNVQLIFSDSHQIKDMVESRDSRSYSE